MRFNLTLCDKQTCFKMLQIKVKRFSIKGNFDQLILHLCFKFYRVSEFFYENVASGF